MSGEIPRELLVEVFRHAREVFPAECCGWLAGPKDGAPSRVRRCRNAQEDGDHPTAAARGAETAYVIAGDDLIALNRGLSTAEPPLVLYHSHPNGRAYFSATDKQVATDPWGEGPMYPVDQLVVGLDGERVVEARVFRWDDAKKDFVEVAFYPGETL
jgi:proteasome lid subunit RPN8/RPN11